MIKITALNKFYKSKRRSICHALKNINLTLPDAGLVFVLGKSGSGKSTLLNLIGGLDNISSGSIEVDGNDLAGFKEKDFCNYRNTHIGFIFQDYHLIDELTVYENIVLSLNLRRIENRDLVKAALAKVDLAGYEDRYPTELSGGEQQRVAIARAIVKNPRIILADEPTGNLDTHTSTAIITLLKQLSKECLILIVSHNVNDANNYADRIIELAKGEIISDKSRNPEFADHITFNGEALIYPERSYLSGDDIELINSNKSCDIVMRSDKFLDTEPINAKAEKRRIENKSLSLGKELSLSGNFLKNKTLPIALSSFMVAVIMVIMALAQTIISFDSGRIMAAEMEKSDQSVIVSTKVVDPSLSQLLTYDFHTRVEDGDIQAFYDAGYKGKIYPIYNTNVTVLSCYNAFGRIYNYFNGDMYLIESFGTLVVDEDFFEDKFGKVEYLAKLDNPHPYGLYITDYLADSILMKSEKHKGRGYEGILGKYIPANWSYDHLIINGVINTGYKEKYQGLFERIKAGDVIDLNAAEDDPEVAAFFNEVYTTLGFSYSLNPDYAADAQLGRIYFTTGKLKFNETIEFDMFTSSYFSFIDSSCVYYMGQGEGEVTMNISKYNEIFGTNYTESNKSEFVPHTITVTGYDWADAHYETPRYSFEATVIGLHSTSDTFIASLEGNEEIRDMVGRSNVFAYGLYFDGTEGIGSVFNMAESMNYEYQSYAVEGIHTMTRAVDVFIPIFELVAWFLCVGVIFILMNFASKMINDKMHEIGILKALGAKNNAISVIFGMQILLISILTCVMATLGYFLFIDLANDVLIESLKRLVPNLIVLDLEFLTFIPDIAAENCILICILSAISLIFPMIKIKTIKPVKIIKAKE